MALFHTILHPTDFDACSVEAFRVARALSELMGAKIIAFHIAPPPAVVTEDGRVVLDPKAPTPVDLWADYRAAQTDTPGASVKYSVMVGKESDATRMLFEMIRQHAPGSLIVMGTHGRTG
jgi:nucleotide-binding universal stress UspA family protein